MNVEDIITRIQTFHPKIESHLTNIVKNRTIELTGDTDHLTIDRIINSELKDIDKPREYDFQKENHFEESLIKSLHRFVPHFSLAYENIDDAIQGKCWCTLESSYGCKCYDCAQPLRLSFNGNQVKLQGNSPCSNNSEFTVDIDFPTGEVVYADWPPNFTKALKAGLLKSEPKESINYLSGQRKRSEHYASQQIFHHSVGNSCPGLFYNKDTNAIQIGGGHYDEDTDDISLDGFEYVGYFCTDLWWATMIDMKFFDQFIHKLQLSDEERELEPPLEIIYVKPGRYRFTCYSTNDDGDNKPYAIAERIVDVE